MEELLEPYVHYVPLYPNLSNVDEQMQWILDHDRQARSIAKELGCTVGWKPIEGDKLYFVVHDPRSQNENKPSAPVEVDQ